MADLNEVRLIGRLTRDPEMRATAGGKSVCTFGLATSKKSKGQDGVQREETTFVDVTCWSKLAENVGKFLRKGRMAYIGGRLKLDSWEDRQTGQKRSKLHVIADNVQFLDRKENTDAMQPPYVGASAVPSKDNFPQNASWDEPNMGEPPF